VTAQDHIDAIGPAQIELEESLEELLVASRLVEKLAARATRKAMRVHVLQDAAQRAFKEAYPEDNIVLFSGGSNKPEPQEPQP